MRAHLRCTSCDRRFDRSDARSGFKCPGCGGLALFDWTEESTESDDGARGSRTRRKLGRWLRPGGE